MFTPYSAESFRTSISGEHPAMFIKPYYPHLSRIYSGRQMRATKVDRKMQPWDPRELQWLQAFLKACAFMEKLK